MKELEIPNLKPEHMALCDEAEGKDLLVELLVGDQIGPEGKERRPLRMLRVRNPRTKRVVGQSTLINEDLEHAAKIVRKKV